MLFLAGVLALVSPPARPQEKKLYREPLKLTLPPIQIDR
jgi:hypothetical protein